MKSTIREYFKNNQLISDDTFIIGTKQQITDALLYAKNCDVELLLKADEDIDDFVYIYDDFMKKSNDYKDDDILYADINYWDSTIDKITKINKLGYLN